MLSSSTNKSETLVRSLALRLNREKANLCSPGLKTGKSRPLPTAARRWAGLFLVRNDASKATNAISDSNFRIN